MQQRRFSWERLVIILASIFFIAIFFGLVTVCLPMDKMDAKNTTELSATFFDFHLRTSGEDTMAEIYVTESSNPLILIYGANTVDFASLRQGDTIYFRVWNNGRPKSGELNSASIVSLRTVDRDLLTLEQYNILVHPTAVELRIAGTITIVVMAALIVLCAIRLKKRR